MNRVVPFKDRAAGDHRHASEGNSEPLATARSASRAQHRGVEKSEPTTDRPHVIPAIKIAVPSLPDDHISRPSLLADIGNSAAGQIVLINAPAGYGKTLLLAEWAAKRGDRTAWVTLDSDDNDPDRFWTAIIAALCACPAVHATNPLHSLTVTELSSRNASFRAIVADALAALEEPISLVLDNAHELVSVDALHGLAALVRNWPANLRLILSTRVEPPLPLGRMRSARRLFELRCDALAFSPNETRSLLDNYALSRENSRAGAFLNKVDGWPACLQLAVQVAIRAEEPDTQSFDLARNDQLVGDYLDTEVMDGLPDEFRQLLEDCSICESVSTALAIILSGRQDAGKLLNRIRYEFQLIRVGKEQGRSFRIHPMLRAHLYRRLEDERPEHVAMLHFRASKWFDCAHSTTLAVRHATLARNDDWMGDLLARAAPSLIAEGQDELVGAALATLPHDRVASNAWLTLSAAMVCLSNGDLASADAHLASAPAMDQDTSRDLKWFRALVTARRAWLGDEDMQESLYDIEHYAPDNKALSSSAGVTSAIAHVQDSLPIVRARLSKITGDSGVTTAGGISESDQDRLRLAHNFATLAYCEGIGGNLRRTQTLIQHIDELCLGDEGRPKEELAMVTMMRTYSALMRAQPHECLRLLSLASDLGMTSAAPVFQSGISITRAAALFDSGERREGFEALRTARFGIGRYSTMVENVISVALFEWRAATLLGFTDSAREVLEWAEDRLGQVGEVLLMRAATSARISRHVAARSHLRPLLDETVEPILKWTIAEGWLLQSEIALNIGNFQEAGEALERALTMFAETGIMRPLMTVPQELIDLLVERLGSLGPLERFAREMLAIRAAQNHQPRAVLTESELAILAMLPSNRTLDEISRDLTVSINTVKTHVKAIYAKLDVNSRRDAVAAAYQTGILSSVT